MLPPGVMYDVDHQCRLQYGPNAELCKGIDVSGIVCTCQLKPFILEDAFACFGLDRVNELCCATTCLLWLITYTVHYLSYFDHDNRSTGYTLSHNASL